VALGLSDAAAVRTAVDIMRTKLRDAGHALEGLLVQKQIEGGVEALVGVTLDPSLAQSWSQGSAECKVELVRDVAFRITPVSDIEATENGCQSTRCEAPDGFVDRSPSIALLCSASSRHLGLWSRRFQSWSSWS